MKKILENFLIVLALGLCALCTYQWYRESNLRKAVEGLSKELYEKKEVIQSLEDRLKRSEADVSRLDTLKTELTGLLKTNKQELATMSKYSEKLEREAEVFKSQIQSYKDAVEVANANIRKQNDDIKKQNEMMKQLAEERNAVVTKYNETVSQYNDLVKQFEKFQQDVQNQNQKKEEPKK